MSLSLCMIARDEADRIADCLRSVQGLVDEIVVVDTGSSDPTPAIARDLGARVIAMPWGDDFAAARNCSLEHATGEWILVLDADEKLYPRHFQAVRHLMAKRQAEAIQVFVRNYTDDWNLMNWEPIDPAQAESQGFCGCYDSPQVRLFRRREGIRFEGIVHESVAPSLDRCELPIHRADVLIHHYKESRPTAQRQARNRLIYELSCRRCEVEGATAEVWRQRALDALAAGRSDDAVAALERAIALRAGRRDLHLQLGAVLILVGQAERARRLCREALDRFPDDPELVQALGEAQLAAGQIAEATETLARSLELDPYLYRSLMGLGAIAAREGRLEAAISYFEQARSIHPELDVPHVNIGLLYLRMSRHEQSLAWLRRAFALNPRRWQTLAGIGAILFETGRFEESRQWYLKAAAAQGCPPEVFAKLGACCTALGLDSEARQWAEKAATTKPQPSSFRLDSAGI